MRIAGHALSAVAAKWIGVNMDFQGRKILMTGSSGPLGGSIARQLLLQGAELALLEQQVSSAHALASWVLDANSPHIFIEADLQACEGLAAIVGDAIDALGHIDVLLNCAESQHTGAFGQESAQVTMQTLKVNVAAPMLMARAVLPHMLERHQGLIVNVGSSMGDIGYPGFASYSASQFALRGFSEALRRELQGSGVQVTHIAPPPARLRPAAFSGVFDRLGIRLDDPADIAHHIVAAMQREQGIWRHGPTGRLLHTLNAILPNIVDAAIGRRLTPQHPGKPAQ